MKKLHEVLTKCRVCGTIFTKQGKRIYCTAFCLEKIMNTHQYRKHQPGYRKSQKIVKTRRRSKPEHQKYMSDYLKSWRAKNPSYMSDYYQAHKS